jgi:4-hydroxy-tetrahydrodipicolinate synthase
VQLQRCLADDRLAEARALWRHLQPLTRACFAEPNPAPIKAALAQRGWLHDELRPPMLPASAATADALTRTLALLALPA